MKIGCILVQNGAFQTILITMSNFKNFKNMEIMRVEKKTNWSKFEQIGNKIFAEPDLGLIEK